MRKKERQARDEEIRRVYAETGNQSETARRCGVGRGAVHLAVVPGMRERAKKRKRAYRKANPEKTLASSRARYARNPEKAHASSRSWREANLESSRKSDRERARARREADPEKARAMVRARFARNPEKSRAPCANRRARKRGADITVRGSPEHARLLWIQTQCFRIAGYIGNRLGIQIDLDHIVPMAGTLVGCFGPDAPANWQLLESRANSSKGNRRIAVCPLGRRLVEQLEEIYDIASSPPEPPDLEWFIGDFDDEQLADELGQLIDVSAATATQHGLWGVIFLSRVVAG